VQSLRFFYREKGPMVRKGIERMGGSAGFESSVGKSSCFWIELPQAGKERP
jgi:signal transduction histidine kinase